MKKIGFFLMLLLVCLQVSSQTNLSNEEKFKQKQLKFFEQKMNEVSDPSTLNTLEKEQLFDSFFELSKISPEKGNKMLFRIAVSMSVNDTTKLYSIFKDEFDNSLEIKYNESIEKYKNQLKLSNDQLELLLPTIYNQAREIRFNYYLAPDNESKRASLDKATRAKYDPVFKFYQYGKTLSSASLDKDTYNKIVEEFTMLSSKSPEKGNQELFRIAVCKYVSDTTSIYNIFKKEITTAINEKFEKDLSEQVQKYNLTDDQLEIVTKLVRRHAKNLILNKYLYKNDLGEKEKSDNKSRSQRDKAILFMLTENGVKTNLTNYCTILEIKEQLGLTELQIKEVIKEGWKLSQLNKKNKNFKLRNEEHKVIKNILNEEQYDKYLSYKSIAKAKEDTDSILNEADKLGLTTEFDSTAYNQILSFNLEKAKVRERYKIVADGQGERDEELRLLNNNKPKVLKKILSAKKREDNKKNQEENSVIW